MRDCMSTLGVSDARSIHVHNNVVCNNHGNLYSFSCGENMTDIRISVATMHYPFDIKREAWLSVQKAHLPMLNIVADWYRDGTWAVARRAWTYYDTGATHHIVLQDDHFLADGFLKAAYEIARLLPDEPVSFYSQRHGALDLCRREGYNFFTNPDGVMSGAVMMPVWMWDDAYHWCINKTNQTYQHDDIRLSLYLMSLNKRVYNTAPSLVQHLGSQDSLVGHNNPENISNYFTGLSNYDWENGVKYRTFHLSGNVDYDLEYERCKA